MSNLLKLTSHKFINKLIQRGLIIDYNLSNLLTKLEKNYISKNIEGLNISRMNFFFDQIDNNDKLEIEYDLNNIKIAIELFSPLVEYNIAYLNYILILYALDLQTLKNLARFIFSKWRKVYDDKDDIYLYLLLDYKSKDIEESLGNLLNKWLRFSTEQSQQSQQSQQSEKEQTQQQTDASESQSKLNLNLIFIINSMSEYFI